MAEPLHILHVTDPHLHAHRDATMRGLNTFESFKAVIERAADDPRKADAIIATGDLVQDETRQGYERFREVIGALDVPVHCVPGNHDSPRIMAETLSAPPFHFCGTRAYGDWRLIMLNSAVRWDDAGRLEATQLKILESTLTKHPDAHVLVGLHHHPLPTGSHWLDGLGLRNSDEFLEIIDRFPQVRGVAWGHVHQASETLRNGVLMLSTPSTGSQFLPDSDVFMMDSRPPAYRWINLYPDGSIETEVVWLS
jgi:Icc protein